MTELRSYQSEVLADVAQAIAAGASSILLVAPTGAGKTIIASSIIEAAQHKGGRVLVLAHTREIIKQTSEKLFANGIEHGIIQAGFMTRPDEPVQMPMATLPWSIVSAALRSQSQIPTSGCAGMECSPTSL